MELALIQRAERVAADLFITHQTKHFTVRRMCVNKQRPMFSRAFHWTHPLPESQVKKLKIKSFSPTNWADLQIVRLQWCFEETLSLEGLSIVLILSRTKKKIKGNKIFLKLCGTYGKLDLHNDNNHTQFQEICDKTESSVSWVLRGYDQKNPASGGNWKVE